MTVNKLDCRTVTGKRAAAEAAALANEHEICLKATGSGPATTVTLNEARWAGVITSLKLAIASHKAAEANAQTQSASVLDTPYWKGYRASKALEEIEAQILRRSD